MFEKINENDYKINGEEFSFSGKAVELIPIVRDIVVQKENIAIENYNLSMPSYTIEKKEVPVADLITEIKFFLVHVVYGEKNWRMGFVIMKLRIKSYLLKKNLFH